MEGINDQDLHKHRAIVGETGEDDPTNPEWCDCRHPNPTWSEKKGEYCANCEGKLAERHRDEH